MYHIAIVEDEKDFSEVLVDYLKQYEEEKKIQCKVTVFDNGEAILQDYQNEYDMILMDIEMPGMNGMDVAEKIREMDEEVVIMFITNMAAYAIRGYSVGALDFVMKPINYYTFSMKMTRALKRVPKKGLKPIVLTLADGMKKLDVKQIYFVEVQNRMVHYHTDEGEFVVRGTLQAAEKMLADYSFTKCNHWYLVNLMHVAEVRKNIAIVGGYEVEISRRNKTAFLKELTDYMGGGK